MHMIMVDTFKSKTLLQGGSRKPLWFGSQLQEHSWVQEQLEGQSFQSLRSQSWISLKLSQCSHSPGGDHLCHSIIFPGLLHPRRHRLLVEFPQHKHHPRLERHSQFLQHWNTSGFSQSGKSSSESKQPLLPELGQQGLGGDLGDDQHPNSWSRRGGFNCPPGEKDLKYFEIVSTRLKNCHCYNHHPRLNLRKISKRKRGRKGKVREHDRG